MLCPPAALQAQANIDSQLSEMTSARAEQAERKLQYLLKQSDIFQHFGVDVGKAELEKRKQQRRMTEKEGDSEMLNSTGESGTRLSKQPSIVNGNMRPYQLEVLSYHHRHPSQAPQLFRSSG